MVVLCAALVLLSGPSNTPTARRTCVHAREQIRVVHVQIFAATYDCGAFGATLMCTPAGLVLHFRDRVSGNIIYQAKSYLGSCRPVFSSLRASAGPRVNAGSSAVACLRQPVHGFLARGSSEATLRMVRPHIHRHNSQSFFACQAHALKCGFGSSKVGDGDVTGRV